MLRSRRTNELAEAPPGAFMPDGSFNEESGWAQQGPAHGLVMTLMRSRRAGTLTPSGAVSLIHASRAEAAFPSADQWAACGPWPACWTQTAAEESVKRAGRGIDGHWCGQQWAAGPEKACDDARHRGKPSREDTDVLVGALVQTFKL
jgi:hypothetical protein